jgi:hypothetical protein
MNLFKSAMWPVIYWTSFNVCDGCIYAMALILSGFASMPFLNTRYPIIFPLWMSQTLFWGEPKFGLSHVSKCNTPSNPWTSGTYSLQPYRIIYRPHNPTWVFCAHFVLNHAHLRKLLGRSPIPNCSEKEDAPYWYGYSINSIKPWARISPSQGPGHHNPPP